jgi:hypothetical protein
MKIARKNNILPLLFYYEKLTTPTCGDSFTSLFASQMMFAIQRGEENPHRPGMKMPEPCLALPQRPIQRPGFAPIVF